MFGPSFPPGFKIVQGTRPIRIRAFGFVVRLRPGSLGDFSGSLPARDLAEIKRAGVSSAARTSP